MSKNQKAALSLLIKSPAKYNESNLLGFPLLPLKVVGGEEIERSLRSK